MNRTKTTLSLLSLIALARPATAADTLRNFNPAAAVPVALQFPATAPGYYTGHNSYNDEEWGEKYYLSGPRQLLGMIAYHDGQPGTSAHQGYYKVYTVGPDAMPGTELAARTVSTTSIDISGNPVYVPMPQVVTVSDSFFVSFGLQEYAHSDPGTQLVALRHSPEGSRAAADTLRTGRNVVRWHNHDHATMEWKDFYSENYTPVRIHLALFPVLAGSTSVGAPIASAGFRVFSPYTSPGGSQVKLKLEAPSAARLRCTILDLSGRKLDAWEETVAPGATTISRPVESLAAGPYILLLETPGGTTAQQFTRQ